MKRSLRTYTCKNCKAPFPSLSQRRDHECEGKTWEQVEKIVHSIAWKTEENQGIPQSDIVGLGHWAFMKALDSYEYPKAKFSTWFTTIFLTDIRNHIQKEKLRAHENEVPEDIRTRDNPYKILERKERFQALSKEAKDVFQILLDVPDELLGISVSMDAGKIIRGALKRFLREKGTPWKIIRSSFQELSDLAKKL